MTNETVVYAFPDLSWLSSIILNNIIPYMLGVISGFSANLLWRKYELMRKSSHMKLEREGDIVKFQGCWTNEEDRGRDLETLKRTSIRPHRELVKIQEAKIDRSSEYVGFLRSEAPSIDNTCLRSTGDSKAPH